jgi:CRP-like cAMP-binding protein
MAAVDGSPQSATGTFLTPGRALRLTGPAFNDIIDTEPSVAAATLRTVARRLRDASDRQLEFGTADAVVRALKMARDLRWLETGRQAFVINDLDELRRHCDLV